MKNSLKSAKIIDAQSMGASVTSSPTQIQFLDNVCYQVIWSAGSTPVGTLSVEVSVNYDPQVNPDTSTWTALTLPVTPSVSGNSGSFILDLNQLSMPWVRLKYVRSSGSGTLNAYISAKEV